MPGQRNYYEVLGLSRTASTAEIKKRYRQLARKYHPDVVADKTAGAKAFVEITEAYKTLVDPQKRRAYDTTLMDVTQPVRPSTAAPRPRPSAQAPQVQKLVKDAEFAFIKRKLNLAAELCKQAIRLDMKCARAHAILGDFYRIRRKYELAINEYNYAVQFDPSDRESQKKMEKLLDRSRPITFSWETPEGRLSLQAIVLNIIGWGTAFFLLLLIYIYPGEPIRWLASYRVPLLMNWSWNLVGIMFGDGVLTGILLSTGGLIAHPDDELIFETGGRGLAVIPTAYLLLVFSPLFFLGAAVVYLVLAFIQDTISKSLLRVFAAVLGIVLLSAVMYPIDAMSVLLLGGNVVFVGMLGGWYIGAMLRSES